MSTKKEPKNRKKKHKLITKGHGKEPTVIEFNLSKAVIMLIIIGVVIAGLVTKEIVTTIIEAKQNNALAEDGTDEEHAVYVQSSDGKQVPVPKGYVASQIPGETSVNDGFVIYEDNYNGKSIDWNSILVETNSLSANSLNANNAINSSAPQATTENQAKDEEQLKTEPTNSTESTNTEETNATENTTLETTNKTQATNKTESTTTEVTNTTENTRTETTTTTQATNKTENTATEQTNVTESTNTETTSTEKTNTEATNIVENKKEGTNTEPTATSTSTTTTESTNKSQKIQNNAQMASNENSIELYADETITQEDINIFDLQKSVNQYVWIPVSEENLSRIYGVDANGKLWGKLYNYSSTGRTANNWTETNGVMNITDLSSYDAYREPTILSGLDKDSILQFYLGGMTAYELLSELEENYYATIKSIKEHGGFYIGRYETGGLSGKAVVRKMEMDINYQTWYTMYEKTKELSGTNDNVITSMIWGSLWDETLQWLVDSGAKISDGTQLTYELIASDSTKWGNYANSTFSYIPADATTPDETATKELWDPVIPTGSAEYTKVNNIYDLAGNAYDWTLEAYYISVRILRGGGFNNDGNPAAYRFNDGPINSYEHYGCRSALFIK